MPCIYDGTLSIHKSHFQLKQILLSVLPWEWNCVFLLPGFVISNVRILHGKGSKETVELLEKSMGEHGTKIFTGDTLMHCEMGKKRKHKIGLTQKY